MNKVDQIMANTEEIVTVEELKVVLGKSKPKAYIGFEPSGTVHLGWKICTNKIKDFIECGFDFTVLLADWHAYINDKLGGDIDKIKLCGKYMEDCFAAMGVDTSQVRFVYASDYVSDSAYWELVLRTAKSMSVARVKRAMDIMGRDAEEAEKDLSKLFYPAMQVSDIFYLDLDAAYGGMDQRRAHMLAREVSKKLGKKAPVAIHTPLLTGLQAGGRMDPVEAKMSKSKPGSMISIHDDPASVKKKMNKAFCPERQVEGNPVLEICRYVVFPELKDEVFLIERPEKFGGNLKFANYKELEQAFVDGLHPLDLKNATAKYVNMILEPVHTYFEKQPENYNKMKKAGIIQ
ncbi:tyrosyl-tRNA synthetase [Thermoplasmatales archaeon SCGC AB-539-N05]|nr:tyrosyl-tRNA synthetase [Thermoplasmatales archaeon SCGC AB-539-N05]